MVAHVVDMAAEVVATVVVAHKFAMEMVPLMASFSLYQLLFD